MKKNLLVILLLVFCLVFSSCSKKNDNLQKYEDYSFDYFDTVTTIIGYEKNKELFSENCEIIKDKLSMYHKLFDIYNKYDGINNLAVINDSKEPVIVNNEIIKMLDFCKKMYDKTNGKVNVAMGSVLSIWHNYRIAGINDPENSELPKMNELLNASKHTDISNIIIDKENNSVFLNDKEMSLDVGAIAKGYAVEQTALYLEKKGINGYILNVGGNVRIVGEREDGKKWTVGIENPLNDEDNPYCELLSLDSMSLVTSGSHQRFYTVNGKNYHHIIDSDTLMPAEYFLTVSILTKDSGIADALSTALFSMSYEDGKKIIESFQNTEAMWILPSGEKKYSKNFKTYCEN